MVNNPSAQPVHGTQANSVPAAPPPAAPQHPEAPQPVAKTQPAVAPAQPLPRPQIATHNPPSPHPNLTATPRPVHANLTSQEKFVNLGSITTSTMSDPINTKNPFSNDFHSSRLYQSLSTPNEQNFRKAILQRTRLVNSIATRNHTQQTSGESGETLISRMLISGENITSSTPLRCRSVKETDTRTLNELGSGRIGVRAVVTSRRLLLVDANKNSIHKIGHATTPSTFLSPPRPKESFSVETIVSDDVWFKPIPLNCITGIEILSRHGSEASALVSNNRHPGWFVLLLVGLLGFFAILASEDDENLVIGGFVLAVIGFVGAMVFYSMLARAKVYSPRTVVYKRRVISLGIYDTISNRPIKIELELEDSQNLTMAYDWCRILQQYAPQLSSEQKPLLLT